MELHLRLEGSKDLSGQIHRQIRTAILDGRLERGSRLPPTRELARRLAVSRNTVGLAYGWLTSEGLLSGRAGAGSFVEAVPAPGARSRKAGEVALPLREIWSRMHGPFDGLAPPKPYDFRGGLPDVRLFPFDEWRRLAARELRASAHTVSYGATAGHPKLRAAIARHVGVARGVLASAEDVFITHGAQQAIDFVGRLFIEPGTRVAVEEPGYPIPRLLFESLGARIAAVRVDTEGMDVAALPDDTRLVYVTPSHQFPLGMPMSHARRAALLSWAERRNAVVIEDDYDSEFRFSGRPLETLQAMDRNGRVIYVGSFSKTMLPALRLGFLIAPASLHAALNAVSYVTQWHCQWPAQAALARFIEEGLLARHIRKMRREYTARHDRIADRLAGDFAEWLEVLPSIVGMHLCATLRRSSRRFERDVADRARQAGLGLHRLSSFYAGDSARPGLVLGYGAIPMSRIDEGLRRLRSCFIAAAQAATG
jgi:GntR family transcriptional regulator/MocR family aminotransferase